METAALFQQHDPEKSRAPPEVICLFQELSIGMFCISFVIASGGTGRYG